jgi:hypothetical protein
MEDITKDPKIKQWYSILDLRREMILLRQKRNTGLANANTRDEIA